MILTGVPSPTITWKREDQTAIPIQNNQSGQNRYIGKNKFSWLVHFYQLNEERVFKIYL